METFFNYDEQGQLIGEYNSDGSTRQEVIYLGRMPIAVIKNDKFYHIYTDHLNTPRVITDTFDKIIWSWHSDPFGKTVANDDPDNNKHPFIFNLRFAGQYYDWETGLHYNYFRDYDPATGRYVQSDPIGLAGGLNTYGYVDSNPLYWIDLFGLSGTVPGRIPQGYNPNDTRGGFDGSGNSLIFHPDYYDPSAASEILVTGILTAITGASGKVVQQCGQKTVKNACKNTALAGLLGLSICQADKIQGSARRFSKHRETITETVKPLPKPKRAPYGFYK